MTQTELGEACKWGEGPSAQTRISNYELGKREPTLAEWALMAEILDVDPGYLAFGEFRLGKGEDNVIRAYRKSGPAGRHVIDGAVRTALGIKPEDVKKQGKG